MYQFEQRPEAGNNGTNQQPSAWLFCRQRRRESVVGFSLAIGSARAVFNRLRLKTFELHAAAGIIAYSSIHTESVCKAQAGIAE